MSHFIYTSDFAPIVFCDRELALMYSPGSGIGRDCTYAYAAEGAAGVIVADINEASAKEVTEESVKFATNPLYRAFTVVVDVTDESSVQSMVDFTLNKFGRIDYCVNSAGVSWRFSPHHR